MAFHTCADGTALFYTAHGAGPPLVLLHGWCCDSHDWSWSIPAWEGRHRVIAADLRGHGRSAAPPDGYTPQALADDVAGLVRAEAGEPVVLVGHSLGTVVASALTVRHPALVRGLVLVDPIYGNEDERVDQVLALLRGDSGNGRQAAGFGGGFYGDATPSFLPVWHRRRAAGVPAHVATGCIAGLFDGEQPIGRRSVAREYLRGRQAPRLAVYRDAELAQLERELPGTPHDRIEIWSGAGHFLHVEEPERFNALVLDWLAGLR